MNSMIMQSSTDQILIRLAMQHIGLCQLLDDLIYGLSISFLLVQHQQVISALLVLFKE